MNKEKINLIYFEEKIEHGNFGDEISKFVVEKLINKKKYELVFNQKNIKKNLIAVGSFLHNAENNYYIYGTGLRTNPPIEGPQSYTQLNISACRGPKTYDFLKNTKKQKCPEVFGDPALLLKELYIPKKINDLTNKIGIVPHKSNYQFYKNLNLPIKYYIINPRDLWSNVVNEIYSCKSIISSSLHGLIISDAYFKPNIMLYEIELNEGMFKFTDYFESQQRPFMYINNLDEYHEKLLYCLGNNINLDALKKAFPFQ